MKLTPKKWKAKRILVKQIVEAKVLEKDALDLYKRIQKYRSGKQMELKSL